MLSPFCAALCSYPLYLVSLYQQVINCPVSLFYFSQLDYGKLVSNAGYIVCSRFFFLVAFFRLIRTETPIDALDAGARFELATFSSWGWWDNQTSLPCYIQTVQLLSALTDTVQHRSIINTIVSIHSHRDLTIISHGTFRFSWPNRTFALETALAGINGLEPLIPESKSGALPLGYTPIFFIHYTTFSSICQELFIERRGLDSNQHHLWPILWVTRP